MMNKIKICKTRICKEIACNLRMMNITMKMMLIIMMLIVMIMKNFKMKLTMKSLMNKKAAAWNLTIILTFRMKRILIKKLIKLNKMIKMGIMKMRMMKMRRKK